MLRPVTGWLVDVKWDSSAKARSDLESSDDPEGLLALERKSVHYKVGQHENDFCQHS